MAPGTLLPAVFTDAAGSFAEDGVGLLLSLSKDGYVSRDVEVPGGQDTTLGDIAIQPKILVSDVAPLTSALGPTDVPYQLADMWDASEWCNPCKWIDLSITRDAVVNLAWSGVTPLQLWAASDYYGAALRGLARPGETTLSVTVPAATRILLVGARSQTSGPQNISQIEPFELTVGGP
jgi:hypothetical protein